MQLIRSLVSHFAADVNGASVVILVTVCPSGVVHNA